MTHRMVSLVAFLGLAGCGNLGENGTQEVADELPSTGDNWVATPAGLALQSCIHEVPNGAHIGADGTVSVNGVQIAKYDSCSTAIGQAPQGPPGAVPRPGGWIESDEAIAPTRNGFNWWNEIAGSFTVPATPGANSGQLLYFFPGLEPSNNSFIVQPVLQYGVGSVNGGGYAYAVASWFVTSTVGYYSSMITASPGDVIKNQTTFDGPLFTRDGTFYTWNISATNTRTGQTAVITTETSILLYTTQAFKGVLEAYSVTNCNQYPTDGAMTFFNETTYMPGPNVTNYNPVAGTYNSVFGSLSPFCSFAITDSSGGATLFY
jgi:hypothetical protein